MANGRKYRKRWANYNFVGRNLNRLKRFGAGLSGAALGYIGNNLYGVVPGYSLGASLVPKWKNMKGKPRFTVNPKTITGSNPPKLIGSNPPTIIGSNPSGPIMVPSRGSRTPQARMIMAPHRRRYKFARKRLFYL